MSPLGSRARECQRIIDAAIAAGLRARRGHNGGTRNRVLLFAPNVAHPIGHVRVAIYPKSQGAYDVRFHAAGSKVAEPETAVKLVLRNYPYRIEG